MELMRLLWIIDYINPKIESSDCIVIEADSYDEAYDGAVEELKNLKIPKRYILKIEMF